MLNLVKGAIFDLDGTLVDSLMFWDVYWEKLGHELLGREGFRPPEYVDKCVRTMLMTEAMGYVNRECKLELDDEMLNHFLEDSLRGFYRNEVKVKPGVFSFLDYLKAKNVQMCVASATTLKYVQEAVECLGLSDYFSAILSCEMVKKGKDQPDIYLKAMECLGTKPENTCVFEDSYVALETAKRIGMHTVGIYDPYNYGHDRLEAASDVYLDAGQSMKDLII